MRTSFKRSSTRISRLGEGAPSSSWRPSTGGRGLVVVLASSLAAVGACADEAAPLRKLPSGEAWYALGQGETEFHSLENGDEIVLVLGGQGSLMFPMPFRGGGFIVPDDPLDWEDPRAPVLDLTFDVDGHNTGFGGHFFRLNHYPLPVEVLPDGSYEFLYVTIFVPDDIEDICELDGRSAQLRSTLEVADEDDPLVFDLDLVIEVPPIYDEPCE